MLTKSSLGLIWFYQRYISPKKGFRCAYRVIHGGTGCSGYAKQRIREDGIIRAIPDIRKRLTACKETALSVRSRCEKGKTRRRARKRDGCINSCDCADFSLFTMRTPSLEENSCEGCGDLQSCDGCNGCDGCGDIGSC